MKAPFVAAAIAAAAISAAPLASADPVPNMDNNAVAAPAHGLAGLHGGSDAGTQLAVLRTVSAVSWATSA